MHFLPWLLSCTLLQSQRLVRSTPILYPFHLHTRRAKKTFMTEAVLQMSIGSWWGPEVLCLMEYFTGIWLVQVCGGAFSYLKVV